MRYRKCLQVKCVRAIFFLIAALLFGSYFIVNLRSLIDELSYQISKRVYRFTDDRTPPLSSVSGPHLTLRSVYHDPRRRYGHTGAYVFLVEVAKPILNRRLIAECRVGGYASRTLRLHPLDINGWVGRYLDERPSLTHTMATVDCFNLPPDVADGSNATVYYYETSRGGALIGVASQRPLFRPRSGPTPTLGLPAGPAAYGVAACVAVLYGRPTFLANWLRYQRTVGVSHVHAIAEPSFVSEGGLSDPVVADMVQNGFLTVDVWEPFLTSGVQIHYHSQLLAYHDCLYRLAPQFLYAMFADQDDFFVPLQAPGRLSLQYYVDRWCHRGSCAFDWLEMYPDCGMSGGDRADGNMTALLASAKRKRLPFKKCIHRLEAAVEVGIHDAREFVPGFEAVEVPGHEGYVAHLRKYRVPADGQCF